MKIPNLVLSHLNRRHFVKISALGILALTGLTRKGFGFETPVKLGLIGCVWVRYGLPECCF